MFALSDLHLDHRNIIDYCDRPFASVEEMNETLVDRWNETVGPDDEVVFAGDLTSKSGFAPFINWIEALHGEIYFVVGNHDRDVVDRLDELHLFEEYRFEYRDVPFCVVHDPADAPCNFEGWVLHGHHHNNHLERFPFIDPFDRYVNLSCELLGYEPIHFDDLIELLQRRKQFRRHPDR